MAEGRAGKQSVEEQVTNLDIAWLNVIRATTPEHASPLCELS